MSLFRRGPGRVSPAEADQRTTRGDVVLLDVREKPEWDAGHAPASVHVPLSRLTAGAGLPQELRGRPLLLICRSGRRSQQAAGLLAAAGADVVDVKGGLIAWERAGLPLVDGRGGAGRVA